MFSMWGPEAYKCRLDYGRASSAVIRAMTIDLEVGVKRLVFRKSRQFVVVSRMLGFLLLGADNALDMLKLMSGGAPAGRLL